MNKFLLAAAGATALMVATGAQAQVTVDSTSTGLVATPVVGTPNSLSFGYVEAGSDSPFAEFLTFTNALAGVYSITLTTSTTEAGSSTDVDFNALQVFLSGGSIVGSILLNPDADNTDLNEDYSLNTPFLASGQYRLDIGGTRGTAGSFGGNIAFSAVPEPGTWGMMLLGFGVVGAAMRRRRRATMLPQVA